MRSRKSLTFAVLMTSSFAACWVASYATAAEPPELSGPSVTISAAEQEARTRFKRALELADDGQPEAALEELKRAYELAPSYRLLYNIGVVYQSLKDATRSVDAYERYLAGGGADIPAERVTEVKQRIERLQERIGFLDVRVSHPGAEVAIDDLPVGSTPLKGKLRVNSGRRKLTVTLTGRAPAVRVVELAGGETKVVAVDLSSGGGDRTPVAPPKSVVPWVSWGITAALAGAATATGIVSLGKTGDYDTLEGTLGVSRAELSSARSTARNFALATDILAGAAAIGVGVSIYFTIKPPKLKRTSLGATSMRLGVQNQGLSFYGSF